MIEDATDTNLPNLCGDETRICYPQLIHAGKVYSVRKIHVDLAMLLGIRSKCGRISDSVPIRLSLRMNRATLL